MKKLAAAGMLGVATMLAGCGSEVVREDGGAGEGGTRGSGQGGDNLSQVDPATECGRLSTLMDALPECKKLWNIETCTVDLEFAIEFGCLEETLSMLRCYASTCQDAEVCRPEGDAFVRCRDGLDGESE